MNTSTEELHKVYQAIGFSLRDHGIEIMFGLVGDANLFMVDYFIRKCGGRFVPVNNEVNAVLTAHGFAQANGCVGVATVTHGPGLTNTITALIEAARSHSPLVLLCGDTPATTPWHLQGCEQQQLIVATGAGFERVYSPETVGKDIARAFYRAASEQRPIVLNIPVDYQWQSTHYEKVVYEVPDCRGYVPASEELDKAVGIIATAKRPIVLAGRGAIHARSELIALADQIEAPLATTVRARSLFDGEPYNLGIYGTLSTPVASDTIIESDCIVAFGVSFNPYTSGGSTGKFGGLFDGKRVIQVELDRNAVGKNIVPTIGVVGDSALTAQRMNDLLRVADLPGSGFRGAALREAIANFDWMTGCKNASPGGLIELRYALNRLDAVIPKNRYLVTDEGRFMREAWKVISIDSPKHMIHASAFTAVGLGAGTAIGTAISADKPTVFICGDGGFMMNGLGEMSTAVREKLDLVIVICNDRCYGAEYRQFVARDMSPQLSCLQWPDFTAIGNAMGLQSITVEDDKSLEVAIDKVRMRDGPVLVNLLLDPDYEKLA